jgi:MFS family permease
MTSRHSKIYYGYWVLAACFILTTVCVGCIPISFSFFVTSLEKALGWSRTEIMSAVTIFFFCGAISGPLVGRLVHRFGGRKVISLGALIMSIGFVILSQMNSLWQYYVGYALIGFGFITSSPMVTSYILSNWFIRRRGAAVGIMGTGAGLSGIIFTPLVIVYLIPNIGWSNTYITFAIIVAVVAIPLALFVIRNKPADMGLLPDGAKVTAIDDENDEITPKAEGLTAKKAISTRAFWLLASAIFLLLTNMGVWQNQTPHLEDLEFSPGIIASAITLFSIMTSVGTLTAGWLCDKIPVKLVFIINTALVIVAISILLMVDSDSPAWLIYIYGILIGFGVGGGMPIMAMLVVTNFGLVSYATIFGMLSFFQSSGAAIGPMFAGYIYDKLGSYHWGFIIIVIAIALAIPFILAVRRPTFPSEQ